MATQQPVVNLEDDKTDSVIAAAVSSMVICVFFYNLRILARVVSGSRILWSDIFLFGGVIACVTISSIDIYALRLGLGRQIAYVAIEDPGLRKVVTMLKFLMVNNCAYALGQVTVKISLCLLYRHIFPGKTLHKLIDATIVYSVLWGIAFVGVAIFSCRPIHAFWEFSLQTLPSTYCINNRAWYVGQAVPNILTDILVLLMPIKQVWALKLDKRSKMALIFIFALGIFVCVISVIRVVSLFAIDNANPTWTLVGIANWSSVEFAIAVMCGSLPTLRPLLAWVRPKQTAAPPVPQIADHTIGGGHKKGSKKDYLNRVHDLETGNSTFAMNDMDTLVGNRDSSGDKSTGSVTSTTRN